MEYHTNSVVKVSEETGTQGEVLMIETLTRTSLRTKDGCLFGFFVGEFHKYSIIKYLLYPQETETVKTTKKSEQRIKEC